MVLTRVMISYFRVCVFHKRFTVIPFYLEACALNSIVKTQKAITAYGVRTA